MGQFEWHQGLAMAEPCGGINEGGFSHRRSAEPHAARQEGCGGLGVTEAELLLSCSCSPGVCTSRTSCISFLPSMSHSFGAGGAPPAPCSPHVSPSRCAHTSGSAVGMLPRPEEWWGIHSRGCRASGQWQGRRRNPGEGHARRPGQLK